MSGEAKTICTNCGRAIPIDKLADHVANCGQRRSAFGQSNSGGGNKEVPVSKIAVV